MTTKSIDDITANAGKLSIQDSNEQLSIDDRIELITRNLEEVMGNETAIQRIRDIITERPLRVYWGTATTGAPHIAYFVPMSKIADFLLAGCEVTILFADVHAYLDNLKSEWNVLSYRAKYYQHIIQGMLSSIGVPLDKLRFVLGSTFQLKSDYTLDLYRLTTLTTERNAKKAGADVVKQVASPLLSSMIYPLLQTLDEQYLGCDAQFGGSDQRKIFTYAETYLPKIGYTKRIHLMNPMVPGLTGGKMSSSEANSKIGLLDSSNDIKKKIKSAFCEEGNIENNGVLSFIRMVLFPVCRTYVKTNDNKIGYLRRVDGDNIVARMNGQDIIYNKTDVTLIGGYRINRPAKWGGGYKDYATYDELEQAFANKQEHPSDLKQSVTDYIEQLLQPIRAKFDNDDMRQLIKDAYPPTTLRQQENNDDDDDIDDTQQSADKIAQQTKPTSVKVDKINDKTKIVANNASSNANDISRLDIRVGRIVDVQQHPNADTLYVCKVDVGLTTVTLDVVSGLVKYYSIDQLTNRLVVVLLNLKPTSMRGHPSVAMILAAASNDGNSVELLQPAEGSSVGQLITVQDYNRSNNDTQTILPRANEKVLKAVFSDLRINDQHQAVYNNATLSTTSGVVTVPTLQNANIK